MEINVLDSQENDYDELEDIYNALVLGTKDYVDKNGFKGIIIGSSGGIDSALTATIAHDACLLYTSPSPRD